MELKFIASLATLLLAVPALSGCTGLDSTTQQGLADNGGPEDPADQSEWERRQEQWVGFLAAAPDLPGSCKKIELDVPGGSDVLHLIFSGALTTLRSQPAGAGVLYAYALAPNGDRVDLEGNSMPGGDLVSTAWFASINEPVEGTWEIHVMPNTPAINTEWFLVYRLEGQSTQAPSDDLWSSPEEC